MVSPVFALQLNKRGACKQAERKVRPSTQNLIWIMPTEGTLKTNGKPPSKRFSVCLFCRRCTHGKDKRRILGHCRKDDF